MINNHNLKPCPFCGCTTLRETIYPYESLDNNHRGCHVTCMDCGASIGMQLTIEDAREAWNKREGGNKHE